MTLVIAGTYSVRSLTPLEGLQPVFCVENTQRKKNWASVFFLKERMFIKPKWLKKGFYIENLSVKKLVNLIIEDQIHCDFKKELNIQEYSITWCDIRIGKYISRDLDRMITYYSGIVNIKVCINDIMFGIEVKDGYVVKTTNIQKSRS